LSGGLLAGDHVAGRRQGARDRSRLDRHDANRTGLIGLGLLRGLGFLAGGERQQGQDR
jgi:hypothetical protein